MVPMQFMVTGCLAGLYAGFGIASEWPGIDIAAGWSTGVLIAATLIQWTEGQIEKQRKANP